jgi:hypothetical protein
MEDNLYKFTDKVLDQLMSQTKVSFDYTGVGDENTMFVRILLKIPWINQEWVDILKVKLVGEDRIVHLPIRVENKIGHWVNSESTVRDFKKYIYNIYGLTEREMIQSGLYYNYVHKIYDLLNELEYEIKEYIEDLIS